MRVWPRIEHLGWAVIRTYSLGLLAVSRKAGRVEVVKERGAIRSGGAKGRRGAGQIVVSSGGWVVSVDMGFDRQAVKGA